MSGARVAHNTILNFLGQAVPLALAFFAMRYLLPGLGVERFGILSIAWITVGYFMVVGFGRAATKYIAEVLDSTPERVASLAWTAAALQFAIGLAGGLLLTLGAESLVRVLLDVPPELQAEAILSFRLLGAGVPIVMVAAVFQGVLEAAQRFDLVNAVRVPSILATFGLPMIGLWLGFGLAGIVVLLVAGKAVVLLAYLLLARRAVPAFRAPPRLQMDALRTIGRFGAWATLSSIVSPALHYLDRIGLGMIVGVAAVGYYTAPFEVITRLRIVPSALVMALFPAISALQGAGDRARAVRLAMMSMNFVLLFMGLAAVVLVAGAHDLLRLWLGPEAEAAAATATQILMAGVVVNALAYVPFVLIQGLGRADIPARLYIVQLPVQVVMVWLFVTWWGIPGAALAWTARALLDTVLLTIAAARLTDHRFREMFDAGFMRSVLLVISATGVTLASVSWLDRLEWRLGAVAATGVVAMLLAWRWALTEVERERLLAIARAMGPRRTTRSS